MPVSLSLCLCLCLALSVSRAYLLLSFFLIPSTRLLPLVLGALVLAALLHSPLITTPHHLCVAHFLRHRSSSSSSIMVRVGLNVTVPAAARPFLPPSNATHTQSQIRESLTFCERIAQGGSCCAIVRAITDAGFSCVIKYYELEPTTAPIPIETDELREFIREVPRFRCATLVRSTRANSSRMCVLLLSLLRIHRPNLSQA